MKKLFTLAFIISSVFANIAFAEDIEKVCADKLDICLEKCIESGVQNCEDTCYDQYNSCFEKEDAKYEKNEEK